MAEGQQLTSRVSEGRCKGGGRESWKGAGTAARAKGRRHEQAHFVSPGPLGLPSLVASSHPHLSSDPVWMHTHAHIQGPLH